MVVAHGSRRPMLDTRHPGSTHPPSLFLLLRSLEHGEFGNPKRSTVTRNSPKADAFVSFGF